MSARGMIAIVCDEDGCTERLVTLQPLEDALVEASILGWSGGVDPDGIRADRCPEHSA